MKVKKVLFFALEFCAFFAAFYLLFCASVNNVVFPFSFGMLFALAWANQKVFLLVPAYVGAGLLHDFSLESAICILVCVFCLVVPYFAHVLAKKNMRKWEFVLFSLLGQSARIAFDALSGQHVLVMLSYLVLGELFMLCAITVFEALIVRGFSCKLTSLELVCLFSLLAAITSGLSGLEIQGFSLLKLFMSFVILIFSFCSSPLLCLLVAATGALGTLVATNNPMFFAPFMLWALACLVFKKRLRILQVLALTLVELVCGLYFGLYASFSLVDALPVVISCVVFMALPKNFCNALSVIFNMSKDRLAMKNVVNRSRELLFRRLGNLSEVFDDMNVIFRKLIKSSMSFEDVQAVLEQEICDKICSFCPEKSHCHRAHAQNTKQVFDELIKIAFDKNRATLLDIPSYLTSRCKQTSAILGSVNTLTAQYKKYISLSQELDTSKLLIAEQLLGVSKIMKSLATEVEANVSFDTVRENKILDELTYNNIICIDAVVFERDIHSIETSVVVRNEDSERLKISDIVSKVCGCKMAVVDTFASTRPGYSVVNLETAPKLDCIFGVSQRTKNGSSVSGDCYSVVKLNQNRLLFAISDGMGSGEKAESASELSISLVENFYKAGFDNNLILSSVNKLLNLHKQEIFSALDILVIDQKNAFADFIKMGSPKSFILSEDECKVVEAGSLPIGIVDEGKPLIQKKVLSERNFCILISDGVADSFCSDEELTSAIKSIKTKNPQQFADELLSLALASNNGYAVDDMTVLVIKTLKF